MNRRMLPILIVLFVALLALSACAVPTPPASSGDMETGEMAAEEAATDEPTEEEAASSGESAENNNENALAFMVGPRLDPSSQAAIAYCEDELGMAVAYVTGPASVTDRLALYLQYFGAGTDDVDALAIDGTWPGILAEHLVDLRPYMTDEQYSAHFANLIENNTVDGALVGIPLDTASGMLYYRTDLLEKYGYAAAPETWTEMEEMAATIQEGERAEGNESFWGYVWQGGAYEGLTCDALEWQVSMDGGAIVERDGTISINNADAAASFDMAASWVGTISPPGVTSYGEEDARGIWQGGNAMFMRNWPYVYVFASMEDSVVAGKFGVSALPKGGEEGRSAGTLGGFQVAVSKYSDRVDDAAAFAVCITSYESQKIRATQGSYLPTISALYEDEEVLATSPFVGEMQAIIGAAGVVRPSTVTAEDYNEVSTIYFSEVHKVLTGEQSGAEAVEHIEAQLQEVLGN